MSDELLSQEAMDDLLRQGTESAEKAARAKKPQKPKSAAETASAESAANVESESEDAAQADEPAGDDIRLYPEVEQVRPVQFSQLSSTPASSSPSPLDLILDVELQVTVELGRTMMQVRDVLELGPGSVVELQKLAGEPVELIVNNKLIARGEVVVIDESFGLRITEIVSQTERVNSLK
jgi:flagellar motor switch protein FliN/FliY